jgi:hypothetical protein
VIRWQKRYSVEPERKLPFIALRLNICTPEFVLMASMLLSGVNEIGVRSIGVKQRGVAEAIAFSVDIWVGRSGSSGVVVEKLSSLARQEAIDKKAVTVKMIFRICFNIHTPIY